MNLLPKHNAQVSRETLLEHGFSKLIQEFDDHEASREGLGYRLLEPRIITKHFKDIGLEDQQANHTEIGSLSGGQKVKVVLAGAMWNNPHLLVLDEPTNFLDRDSMGALAGAIEEYKGGVVIISHNEEFVKDLVREKWHVADGQLTIEILKDPSEESKSPSRTASPFPASPFPASSAVSSAKPSPMVSAVASANASGAEDGADGAELKFRAAKKKKMTKKQQKERVQRFRQKILVWESTPDGTPKPRESDDEGD